MNETMAANRGWPWRSIALWAGFIALDTGTQLAFKWGADGISDLDFGMEMIVRALGLPGVWLAAVGYALTFVVWMLLLKDMPLSRAFPMTGLAYVTVPLFSWLIFRETIDLERAAGIAIIIAGVVVLAGGGEETG